MCIRDRLYEAPPEEQNLETVLYMLENGGASEEDEAYRSPLDLSLIHI